MSNRKKRLDRALNHVKALTEAKRRRENPLLAVEWLPEAQERARRALGRIRVNVADDASEADQNVIDDQIKEIIREMWAGVLNAASNPGYTRRTYHVVWQVGWFNAFADVLLFIPAPLLGRALNDIKAAVRHEKRSLLHDWLRYMAGREVSMPEELSIDAMGTIVQTILEHGHELHNFLAYCAKCRLPCLMHKMNVGCEWKGMWLETCPNCGESSWRHVYRFS